ncbi:hypothetical protein F5I97DRAFT_1803057 [Phlebopus sp. FC_14]|nr:hypothetical protein F5I97DRAFT_1803057 [Phlebopus sp. FC_14]
MSSIHSQSSGQTRSQVESQSQIALPYSSPNTNTPGKDPRRFSLPSFAFLRSDTKLNAQSERKPTTHTLPVQSQTRTLSKAKDTIKKSRATREFTIRALQNRASNKRAKESAVIVRALIIGDHNTSPNVNAKENKVKSPSRSDITRVKTQLLQAKSASKVISHLRALPAQSSDTASNTKMPIHAVCLDVNDQEADVRYFAPLGSVATASIDALSAAFADMHLVDLLTAPDMGFGAPVTAQGVFAGSVPTAETVLQGMEQITPQLLALGYATGKAILPDHRGVIVPNDRISVLTYWWGLELCLPPPTLTHLETVASPSSALLNLLTALSVLNAGVREVLPFVRYVAQFVRTEWHAIKAADEGKGVVCCATWIMPAALVPRAWDFADLPRSSEAQTVQPTSTNDTSATRPSTTVVPQKSSTDGLQRSSSAYSEETGGEDEERPAISSEPPVLPELVVSSPTSMDGRPEVEEVAHEAHDQVQHEGEAIVP